MRGPLASGNRGGHCWGGRACVPGALGWAAVELPGALSAWGRELLDSVRPLALSCTPGAAAAFWERRCSSAALEHCLPGGPNSWLACLAAGAALPLGCFGAGKKGAKQGLTGFVGTAGVSFCSAEASEGPDCLVRIEGSFWGCFEGCGLGSCDDSVAGNGCAGIPTHRQQISRLTSCPDKDT